MNRRAHRRVRLTAPFMAASTAVLLIFVKPEGARGDSRFADSIGLADSVALPLAETFLRERDDCASLPGAIVPLVNDSGCRHPLDLYVQLRNDSVVILEGGKPMLAAYQAFRRVGRNDRAYTFVHKEFLEYTRPPTPPEEPGIVRFIKKLLGWTLWHVLRFVVPGLVEIWNGLSSPGRTAVILVTALLMLAGSFVAARALARSGFVRRKLSPPPQSPAERSLPTDWLAKADASLREGRSREALAFLYHWLTTWTAERGLARRNEWWTNRQLIAALGRSRPAIRELARSLVTAYEETEYGHRAADAAVVNGLRDLARFESRGGGRQ